MTKVVLEIRIIAMALAVVGVQPALAAGPSRVEATAHAQIIDPNEILILRPGDVSAEGKAPATRGTPVYHTVSRRQVRINADGHVIKGDPNVQFITIDVH